MMASEALLDAFVDANILLCIAYALWLLMRGLMSWAGFKHDFGTQLGLLNAVFIAIVCAPFLAAGFGALQSSGVATGVNVNISDMVVSYYLRGGLEMRASEFEGLVLLRDSFVRNIIHADGILAQTVIATFLTGLVLGLARLGYSIFCLWRIVAESYGWRRCGRVRICLSDRVLVPFTTRALYNYYVVIPSHMLGQGSELKVSLAHEFQHIRQGDLEWEVLLEALKPLFFVNPAFHVWKRRVEQLRELNCDSKVVSSGRIDVRDYCETLLSVCQKTMRRDRAFAIAVPKVTLVTADRTCRRKKKPVFLEHRIRSALNAPKRGHERPVFLATAIPLIAAVILTSIAIQRPGDWSHDRIMLSTVVNLERLNERNQLSTFGSVGN